ncbi:hypothetical protein [Occultella gossypii]|uniref:Uncharacterized protein n=1 Tax=Occultella gossypii TaxID=2800820 RepID=A0ABS7S6T3_9MICO|nr:hypothetical protein [Occultella gossypii]MBZ2196012.1 hypothetical protein [Occultella gossypii]
MNRVLAWEPRTVPARIAVTAAIMFAGGIMLSLMNGETWYGRSTWLMLVLGTVVAGIRETVRYWFGARRRRTSTT